MSKSVTWRELVERALKKGSGDNATIYARVAKALKTELTPNQKAKVRQVLQQVASKGVVKTLSRKQPPKRKPPARPKKTPAKPKAPVKPKKPAKPKLRGPALPKDLWETGSARAFQKIKLALDKMERCVNLQRLGAAHASIHTNKDSTIDGEVRINTIAVTIRKLFLEMEQCADEVKTVPWSWVSIVLVRPVKADQIEVSGFLKVRDKYISKVELYPRRAKAFNIADMFLKAQEVEDSFRGHKRRKSELIIYRLHWNPQAVQPGRRKK